MYTITERQGAAREGYTAADIARGNLKLQKNPYVAGSLPHASWYEGWNRRVKEQPVTGFIGNRIRVSAWPK